MRLMTTTEQPETSKFRSNVYGILALTFSTPKASPTDLYTGILNAYTALCSAEDPAMEAIGPSTQNFEPAQLDREHLKLFVGPGRIKCAPYESSHRKDRPNFEKGLVMGPSTADVRRRYAEAGLEFSKHYTDLPDHIAVEMDFMHYLCNEESKLLQQGNHHEAKRLRKLQQEFLDAHLKPWVETFADCVLRSTDSQFYKAAANLLKVFMKSESDNLQGRATE